jgi:hypothetical protein
VLDKAQPLVECVIDTPQAIAPQGLDRVSHGAVPHGGIWRGGMIEDVANAEFVTHPRDTPQLIHALRQDVRA